MASSAFLPELGTQVVVPVAAVVGIAFAVLQWVLVSKVKLSPEPRRGDGSAGKSGAGAGASEYLIEEEEGLNEHNVVVKYAEIQNAISEGEAVRPCRCSCFRIFVDPRALDRRSCGSGCLVVEKLDCFASVLGGWSFCSFYCFVCLRREPNKFYLLDYGSYQFAVQSPPGARIEFQAFLNSLGGSV
jgi:hypothetical protein